MRDFDFAWARTRMVETQLKRRAIADPLVLAAMGEVPRERFVSEGQVEFAYDDTALPIDEGQTISQPYIVALMLEAARLRPGDRVLEVGAGSGYAAAVASRIAGKVFAIERHASLVEAARGRLEALSYDNVVLRHGDGTQGWPHQAPFDAILVAAAGAEVPQALRQQLAIGGRLIIPTGPHPADQSLRRITRKDAATYEDEILAPVRFVPLIGDTDRLSESVRRHARPLPGLDDREFGAAFAPFGDRRVVLLGEASHGTSEFYRARAAITRHLIEHHGFDAVAVEADWPDAAAVNAYIGDLQKLAEGPRENAFQRFPTWMWRNDEFEEFVHWLRGHNQSRAKKVGFYGLDLYNMRGSIAAVLAYLDRHDPEAARIARERYGCLMPWQRDPAVYGRAVLTERYRACEDAVVAQCRDLLDKQLAGSAWFDAAQNARLIAAAERYYRIMYYGGAESWNLRDTHMFDTLSHILEQRGPQSKVVVWAHNSHIGDARFTEMGAQRDEINIGQLTRERFGRDAALIGFSTHDGTVMAASDWDGEAEIKKINPSLPGSWERVMHEAKLTPFVLDMRDGAKGDFSDLRPERFIGVIYRPDTERDSHYAEAVLAEQFDALVWFDRTQAVTPLKAGHRSGVPETYPFGF